MPGARTPQMLVVVDGRPSSMAGVAIAERVAGPDPVVLAGWEADPIPESITHTSIAAQPTVSEAFRLAAQQQIGWVALPRDIAQPQDLLGEILMATAQYADDEHPGFAVFLADGEPRPFRRILAVVDQRTGPSSGLLACAAVEVAERSSAILDVLVIDGSGPALTDEPSVDLLSVNREQQLLDRAVTRAVAADLTVNWLPVQDPSDPWLIVRDQLRQHTYDLVIDDLGDLTLGGRSGLERTLELAVAPGQVGELPLRLLAEVPIPVLLVVDEIRLGTAPRSLLKAGAVAALTLGIATAGALSMSTSPTMAAVQTVEDPAHVGELVADLEAALGQTPQDVPTTPADEATAAAGRAAQAEAASRGGNDVASARAVAEAAAAASAPVATSTDSTPDDTSADAATAQEKKGSQEPDTTGTDVEKLRTDSLPKAPAGGADPGDVARVAAKTASAQETLAADVAVRAEAKAEQTKAQTRLSDAEVAAEVALNELQDATESLGEATSYAEAVVADADGLTGILPGGATPEQAQTAVTAATEAGIRQGRAADNAESALTALTSAQERADEAVEQLAEARADVTRSEDRLTRAEQVEAVYRESLASSRQSPVAAGDYRITARFGDHGWHWSSGVHTGLDFAGSTGTPITAAASGTVLEVGWAGAYGNRVVVDVGDGYRTTYNHMSSTAVSVGQKVQTGDPIGTMGATGNTTGTHLHFEVLKGETYVDPEDWLGW